MVDAETCPLCIHSIAQKRAYINVLRDGKPTVMSIAEAQYERIRKIALTPVPWHRRMIRMVKKLFTKVLSKLPG